MTIDSDYELRKTVREKVYKIHPAVEQFNFSKPIVDVNDRIPVQNMHGNMLDDFYQKPYNILL